jgi:hypothetical protein
MDYKKVHHAEKCNYLNHMDYKNVHYSNWPMYTLITESVGDCCLTSNFF